MSKVTLEDIDKKLESFAEALGLEWLPYSEQLVGKIDRHMVKEDENVELTAIAKDTHPDKKMTSRYYGFGNYGESVQLGRKVRVPTLKGKIEAIAEHLGLEFVVAPENVLAEKIMVKVDKEKKQ